MTRVLMHSPPAGGAPVELARFTLVGDQVVALYLDQACRTELERDGVYTSESGQVKTTDGKRFFDALKPAYARSTFYWIEDR